MSDVSGIRGTDGDTAAAPGRSPQSNRMPAAEAPLGELFKQLAQDSSVLMRQEIALAKAELKESVGAAVGAAVWLPVWGAVALVGSLVLVTFLVLLLGDLLNNYWLAALIVGVVFTGLGALMALAAMKKLKTVSLTPETTVQTLRQDRTWVKSEMDGLKRDLTK